MRADQAQLDNAGKICAAIHYAALDEAKLWETLELATTVPADWANFITAVKQLYPRCEGPDRYYHSDLHNLVQVYHVKPMKNREELGEYHRKFQKVVAHLISTDRLSSLCEPASLQTAYSPYTYNQPSQTFQQQPASTQPRNSAPHQQPPAQTTTPPTTWDSDEARVSGSWLPDTQNRHMHLLSEPLSLCPLLPISLGIHQ
ncbi:hypothetical protein PAXINDRAFT_15702 [Paxillus involutus ATCC 200175]|uniref:Retrotransposon gag domain-containing protein n=1 Tax=Paxillus involutus ATCC 200175 TaxID=664439 RepID=A0A0C9TVP8_PAXIN|nr:hypothetical protein PAXINDRAFT_15702 [Paxillus involutus ATCC 200175]